MALSLEEIGELAQKREIHMRLDAGGNYDIELVGGYEDYSEFFRIGFRDVEYVSGIAGWHYGHCLHGNLNEMALRRPELRELIEVCEGTTYIFVSDDVDTASSAGIDELFIIVGSEPILTEGRDWSRR